MKSVFPIKCAIQKYAWGKIGAESTVAQLSSANGETIEVDQPYAELWMGTHVNGPAKGMVSMLLVLW